MSPKVWHVIDFAGHTFGIHFSGHCEWIQKMNQSFARPGNESESERINDFHFGFENQNPENHSLSHQPAETWTDINQRNSSCPGLTSAWPWSGVCCRLRSRSRLILISLRQRSSSRIFFFHFVRARTLSMKWAWKRRLVSNQTRNRFQGNGQWILN